MLNGRVHRCTSAAVLEGCCANLARTYCIGPPDKTQAKLLEACREMHESVRGKLRPGAKVLDLDMAAHEVCTRAGLEKCRLNGVSHAIGLRFEATPARTILPQHRIVVLREGMTMTVGHTIITIPGVGGVRFEDVFRVTPEGVETLHPYPIEWEVPVSA